MVSLPATEEGAENVIVPYINMPRKRFKVNQQEEKKMYLEEWFTFTENALEGVDISQLKDADFVRLGITQELGRRLVKTSKNEVL